MRKTLRNDTGVTMVELLITIVILGIIALFSTILVGEIIENTKQKGDVAVVSNLNEASRLMRYSNASATSDIFDDYNTNEQRLDLLLAEGYISKYPEPLIDTNSYEYDLATDLWVLAGSGGSIIYTDTDESFFTISATKLTGYDVAGGLSVVIPKSVNGTSITDIGQDCFKGLAINTVIIPEGITRISGNSFHTNNLTTVSIPNSVTRIWHNAFNANQISSISFGNGVTRIEAGAFSNNSLSSLSLPSSVSYVGSGAFGYGSNFITTITIGSDVTIDNSTSFGWYGNTFKTFYDLDKEAGTYTFSNGSWTK